VRLRNHATPTKDQVRRELWELGWWYQDFEVPPGVWTGLGSELSYRPHGRWELMEPYIPDDLSGMSVLDLGGNCGFFSIQMLLRGASRAVIVDPFVEFEKQAIYAAKLFGVRLEFLVEDVHTYCLTTDESFDYVIFLGLLYHLRYPNLVLDRLAAMTNRRMFVQTHVIGPEEDFVHEKEEYAREDDELLLHPAFPKMTFLERVYNTDPTNWWFPNYAGFAALVRAAGLEIVARPHAELIVADPVERLGSVRYPRLVFPRYGRPGYRTFPGRVTYEPELWQRLLDSRTERPTDEPR
jgi:tRNA (mo5U34)-methyltransferase